MSARRSTISVRFNQRMPYNFVINYAARCTKSSKGGGEGRRRHS